MTRMKALFMAAILLASPALADEIVPSKKAQLRIETLAGGLENPWGVEALPDGGYLVTEKPGRLRIVRDGALSQPIAAVPAVAARGQGGLLDVALARDFAQSRRLFLSASVSGNGGYGTAIFSARLSGDEKSLEDVKRVFLMNRLTAKTHHFGSRIAVAKDGSLFFGIGDRGQGDRAQDLQDHAGSILHIDADGKPGPGNAMAGALPEIWSKGHRNPQGIAIDPEDGRLYTVEHGARGGDEVNRPETGKNYGWPVITYGVDYSGADIGEGTAKQGYEQPLYYWDPSIAPGALAIYEGDMFPEWKGNLLVAALKYQLLSRLERDADGNIVSEERLLKGTYGRIRDVSVAPDGSVLLLTDDRDGRLLRLSAAPEGSLETPF